MKTEKFKSAAIGFFLALLLSVGGVGCFTTAFSLHLEHFGKVILWCGAASLFFTAAYSLKHGGIGVLLALAAAAGYQWRLGDFSQQFWQLVYRVSHIYNEAYHWGVFQLVDTPWNAGQADLPMMALGTLLALAAAWSVCREKGTSVPVGLSLLTLLPCVVVTDTVPQEFFLYLLLLGMLLLLLTGTARQENPCQGNRLTLFAVLPVMLGLGILFLAIPKDGYVSHAGAVREQLALWFQSIPQKGDSTLNITLPEEKPLIPETVNLSTLGRRQDSPEEVLSVTAETGGTLYLRGQDYDIYDGTFWRSSKNRVEDFRYDGERLGYVTVETRQELNRLYLPYYPRGGLSLIGGNYDNLRMERNYSFVRTGLPDNWKELADAGNAESGSPALGGYYLTLPEDTEAGARELLAPVLEGLTSRSDKAHAIGEFVRQTAVYDKNTEPMPEGGGDFALWFLREAETGYCVHYATAATVLLRAAGIEARYVSGYQISLHSGEEKTATGENAHAWVEYYEPGLNAWLILDPTPAQGLPDPTQETQGQTETLPAPTEETPPETQPVEEPTIPQPTQGAVQETAPVPTPPEPQKHLPPWAGKAAFTILTVLLLAALLEGQVRLRRSLRRWDQHQGNCNRQALRRWREAERLKKLLDGDAMEELKRLALKAKYSQHTLTEAELEVFDRRLREARFALQEKPLYLRILYRYIFAI